MIHNNRQSPPPTPVKKVKTSHEGKMPKRCTRKRALFSDQDHSIKKARSEKGNPIFDFIGERLEMLQNVDVKPYSLVNFEEKIKIRHHPFSFAFQVRVRNSTDQLMAHVFEIYARKIESEEERAFFTANAILAQNKIDYVFAETGLDSIFRKKARLPIQKAIAKKFCLDNLEFVEKVISEIKHAKDRDVVRIFAIKQLLKNDYIDEAQYLAIQITTEKCKALAFAHIAIDELNHEVNDAIKTLSSLQENSSMEKMAHDFLLHQLK